MTLVAFMDDLMFLSRIREAARAASADVQVARDAAGLVATCRSASPTVVFVDLESRRLPALEAIAAVRAEKDLEALPIVGFFGHTRVDLARAAEDAGCTRVLTRGAFVTELPRLIVEPPGRSPEV